jgi:hypothetical protein
MREAASATAAAALVAREASMSAKLQVGLVGWGWFWGGVVAVF